MKDKGLEIFLWYACNLKCKFCFQKDLRFESPKNLDTNQVMTLLRGGYENGKKFVVFSWGEPTLDANLINYVNYAQELWYEDIRIHTNGLSFADIKILQKYVKAGMTGVVISIHGYGDIHDILVKSPGAFEKVKQTLCNLVELNKNRTSQIVVDTNTVLNKYNYRNLYPLCKFFSYFPITRSQIVQLYSLYLFDEKEKRELYVTYDALREHLDSIFSIPWINISLENFPLCKVDSQHWDYVLKRKRYNNDAVGQTWEWLEESSCRFLPSCEGCKYKDECVWIPKDYLAIFPKEIFSF